MGKKQLKKELTKPDKFTEFVVRMGQFFSRWGRELFFVALAVLVGWLGWASWQAWAETQNRQAADALEVILKKYPDGRAATLEPEKPKETVSWANLANDLREFIQEHKRRSLVPMARLYLGRALLETGKFEDALESFRSASRDLQMPYVFLAKDGQATALMELGKWNEAEAQFEELSKAEQNPMRSLHLYYLGISRERSGKRKEALLAYREFEKDFSDSPMFDEVQLRLATLEGGVSTP